MIQSIYQDAVAYEARDEDDPAEPRDICGPSGCGPGGRPRKSKNPTDEDREDYRRKLNHMNWITDKEDRHGKYWHGHGYAASNLPREVHAAFPPGTWQQSPGEFIAIGKDMYSVIEPYAYEPGQKPGAIMLDEQAPEPFRTGTLDGVHQVRQYQMTPELRDALMAHPPIHSPEYEKEKERRESHNQFTRHQMGDRLDDRYQGAFQSSMAYPVQDMPDMLRDALDSDLAYHDGAKFWIEGNKLTVFFDPDNEEAYINNRMGGPNARSDQHLKDARTETYEITPELMALLKGGDRSAGLTEVSLSTQPLYQEMYLA